jgi:hypothetical protein
MPPKPFDPTRPTFYLDNSTLCAAIKAHRLEPDAPRYSAYRPLAGWVERVAKEANLCLSTAHIIELARWEDEATADAMARWYEGLPVVWVRSRYGDTEDFEAELWTRVAAGVPVDVASKPFAPSLLTAFRALDAAAVSALLAAREPILALLKAQRRIDFDHYVGQFMQSAEQFRPDRQWAEAQGWTEQRRREETEYNIRVALRRRAQDADGRLTLRGDSLYAKKKCSSGEVQDALVDVYTRDPRAMPLFRADRRFFDGAAVRVVRGRQESRSLHDALRGSLCDWLHLVGAAYCDVFTCDRAVSDWLRDLRSTLGLHPQLAVGGHAGGVGGFVAELMATWPYAADGPC